MMLQAVAHDVKNKLAELAMRLMDTDIEAAALALDAADKLSQALLLDSPDELTPQIDATSPIDLAEELVAVHRQLFAEKSVLLDAAGAPSVWYYDVQLMRLALANTLHNALKYCASKVALRVFEDNGFLIFEVRDDGVGMPEDVLAVSEATGRHPNFHGGHPTGMGLRLSRKIVRAHTLAKDGTVRSGSMTLTNDNGAVARLAIP